MSARSTKAGFSMVELLLALGLLSILFAALVQLLDTSLRIWDKTEVARDVQEMGSSVLDLMARDLASLEAGPRGDLVGDWALFDVDRDGAAGAPMPRLRFVRQATAVDLLRARPEEATDEELTDTETRYRSIDPDAKGLMEVCWALLPATNVPPEQRPLGLLWRGERLLLDDGTVSMLDERFFTGGGRPAPGSLELVTGGVLWLDVWYASQTTILRDGWEVGDALRDAATSWDAWNRERPNDELTELNTMAAGMPDVSGEPLLPRRLLVTLELERPIDVKRRPMLISAVSPESSELVVDDETRAPEEGAMILVDEEWMKVMGVGRGYIAVLRGQRSTRRSAHDAGTICHWGVPMTREIPVPTVREDWDL